MAGKNGVAALAVAALLVIGCQSGSLPTPFVTPETATALTPIEALRPIHLGSRENDPKRAHLRNKDLVGVDFRKADLSGADLSGLDLNGANFSGADLSMANLKGAKLVGAVFTNANLRGTNFEDATMQDAILDGWNMDLANFDGVAFVRNTIPKDLFRGRRLVGNVFENVDLSGADFTDAILIGVSFQDSNLQNARFRDTVMKGVYFPDSRLNGADITGVRFEANGLYEGRKDLFVWIVGMAPNELPPTVEQVKGELGGRLTPQHSIRKFKVPPLPKGVFATACADPSDMADLPPGVLRPGKC